MSQILLTFSSFSKFRFSPPLENFNDAPFSGTIVAYFYQKKQPDNGRKSDGMIYQVEIY